MVSYLPYKVVIPPPKKYVFPKTPPAICLQGRAGHGSTELAEVSVPAAESHETPGISSMSFCRLVQDLAKRRWVETSLPAVSQVEPPAVSQVEPPAVSQVEPLRIARAEAPAPRPAAQPNATSTPSLQLRTHTRRYPPSRSVVECGVKRRFPNRPIASPPPNSHRPSRRIPSHPIPGAPGCTRLSPASNPPCDSSVTIGHELTNLPPFSPSPQSIEGDSQLAFLYCSECVPPREHFGSSPILPMV